MKRVKDAILTLLVAARYSFSFCWRNSKQETVGRLIISALVTILMCFSVQVTGHILNAVQVSVGKFQGGGYTFRDLLGGELRNPILLLVCSSFFGILLGQMNWFYRGEWNRKLAYANRRELNEHRATLDVARFRSEAYDNLEKRIEELPQSWGTRIGFSNEMFSLYSSVTSFVLFGASLIWYKPIYALVLVLTAIPMIIVEFWLVTKWWNLFQELVPHNKQRGVLERAYRGVVTFTQAITFNQMRPLRQLIDVNTNIMLDKYKDIRKTSLKAQLISQSLLNIGLCFVIVHAIWTTVTGVGEIGTLTVIITSAKSMHSNLESVVALIAEQWNSAKGVILIHKDFLGMKPLLQTERPIVPDFKNAPPLIRFDRVCFTYPETEKQVLTNVSFTIQPGSKVAIVGKSGNGKSTLLSLLMRYYDPTAGSIHAGDICLRNIEPKVWYETISALTQDYSVLDRQVGAEIASSRLGEVVDPKALDASSIFANFEEVVAADPQGYGSQIGTEFGGREFSGGERQRLALARVHYRGTPILILDEPDAKLDPESAERVVENMLSLKGVTVIMITHHVSRAERCDKVIVMGSGEVIEEGTHAELLDRGGTYTSLYGKDRKRLGSKVFQVSI